DQLEPDSPPCHPYDLLSTDEVAALRGCKRSKVYKLRKTGLLQGTPDEPYQFFGWSVLKVMSWMAPPTQSTNVTPRPPSPPAPRRRTVPTNPPRAVQGLRHLRLPSSAPLEGRSPAA